MYKSLALLVLFAFSIAGARAQAFLNAPRPELLKAALTALEAHRGSVKDTSILGIIDYSLPSNQPRLFLIDRQTGKSEAFLVAHGRGSDPNLTGVPSVFSNQPESRMSSLGAYVTGATYQGAHGTSRRLIGLDPTNNHAADRAIVIHGAAYVAPGRKVLGRSWGCPAVSFEDLKVIMNRLQEGAFLYVAH